MQSSFLDEKMGLFFKESLTLRNINFFPQSTSFLLKIVLFEEISTLSNKVSHFNPHIFELMIHMIATLASLAGIEEHVNIKYVAGNLARKTPRVGVSIYIIYIMYIYNIFGWFMTM